MTILSFLADLLRDEGQRSLLDRLLLALFDMAAAVDVRKAQIVGSPAFSAKLRCVCWLFLLFFLCVWTFRWGCLRTL